MTDCPRCGRRTLNTERPAFNALSRHDNHTYVCTGCGSDEALRQMIGLAAWPSFPNTLDNWSART